MMCHTPFFDSVPKHGLADPWLAFYMKNPPWKRPPKRTQKLNTPFLWCPETVSKTWLPFPSYKQDFSDFLHPHTEKGHVCSIIGHHCKAEATAGDSSAYVPAYLCIWQCFEDEQLRTCALFYTKYYGFRCSRSHGVLYKKQCIGDGEKGWRACPRDRDRRKMSAAQRQEQGKKNLTRAAHAAIPAIYLLCILVCAGILTPADLFWTCKMTIPHRKTSRVTSKI
jgi:hypothetical protein